MRRRERVTVPPRRRAAVCAVSLPGMRTESGGPITPAGPEPPVTENASLAATLPIANEEPLEIKPITYAK
jgi:hypothetical protein